MHIDHLETRNQAEERVQEYGVIKVIKLFTHAVSCPHCGTEIVQNWAGYVVSSDVVNEDRRMEVETEHSIECDELDCPKCGEKFSVFGSVWEYPVGAYNYHELHTSAIKE